MSSSRREVSDYAPVKSKIQTHLRNFDSELSFLSLPSVAGRSRSRSSLQMVQGRHEDWLPESCATTTAAPPPKLFNVTRIHVCGCVPHPRDAHGAFRADAPAPASAEACASTCSPRTQLRLHVTEQRKQQNDLHSQLIAV